MNIEQAIQFRRKEDAQHIKRGWHWQDTQVTEHGYPGGELPEATYPQWPALDPESGDFTDGWNQAIDLCKQAFQKWSSTDKVGAA